MLRRVLGLGGAGIAIVAGAQTWFAAEAGQFIAPVSGEDIPLQFLADYRAGDEPNPSVGALVSFAGGLAALLLLIPRLRAPVILARVLGIIVAAVAAAFLVQLARAAGEVGVSFVDWATPTAFIVVGAGLLMMASD